jgi:RimJ/RimL family protein N-acetyltransferase
LEKLPTNAGTASTIPRIRTKRLLLREWRADDREPFAALNADPVVMEHFPGRLTCDESDALVDRIVEQWSRNGYGLWAIERSDDAGFLGFVGLASPACEADFTPAVEIGWRLGRHAWGHGYATEAARAALRFGFETLGLDEILSWTVPSNTRSRAVMERLGMTHDPSDDFDHPGIPVGNPLRRHVLYRLSRVAWEVR